jgi:hypothetical protein
VLPNVRNPYGKSGAEDLGTGVLRPRLNVRLRLAYEPPAEKCRGALKVSRLLEYLVHGGHDVLQHLRHISYGHLHVVIEEI